MILRSLLVLALVSCSPQEAEGGGAGPRDDKPSPAGGGAAGTQDDKPMPGNALFREDFRTAYGSVLWTMMFLRLCNARWDRPKETAELEARFASIEAQAISRGLKPRMEQAAADKAQQMATMRLDTQCHGGFERARASADRTLTELERMMTRQTDESDDDSQAPPQNIRIAYLGVDAAFFSLQACREPNIVRKVAAQRSRFEDMEQRIARKLGRGALTSLRDHASMQSAMKMVEQCAGDRGMQRLRENLDRLAAALS